MLVFFRNIYNSYEISGQIFGLISSFLSNRWYRVVLDGKSSQQYPVNAGVPQGSILGPTLFLLYINDLPDDVICNIAIYADDATLYSKHDKASDLAHRQNIASLSIFYRYYFGRCSYKLAQLVPLPYSQGRPTRYSDRLHDFSVAIPRCYKNVYVNSFSPRTARHLNSLPIECFPSTYNLSGFKSRINGYLLSVGSF